MSRKNIPNKDKIDPYYYASKYNFDPFETLILFAIGDYEKLGYETNTETKYTAKGDPFEVDRITPEIRLNATKEAAKYVYSQRKAIEHSASDGSTILAPVILRPSDIKP